MAKQKTERKNIHGKPEISSGHDIAVTSSKWFGAAFFYIINIGKIPMKELWSRKYAIRNLWVGYLIKLMLLFFFIYVIWVLETPN